MLIGSQQVILTAGDKRRSTQDLRSTKALTETQATVQQVARSLWECFQVETLRDFQEIDN
jgi:hypothetical protein